MEIIAVAYKKQAERRDLPSLFHIFFKLENGGMVEGELLMTAKDISNVEISTSYEEAYTIADSITMFQYIEV